MNKPRTLQELRDFFANIPEDKWCVKKRGILGTDVHCAVGHMVAAFMDCYDTCWYLKLPISGLIQANDYGYKGPKASVLEFIDKYISD